MDRAAHPSMIHAISHNRSNVVPVLPTLAGQVDALSGKTLSEICLTHELGSPILGSHQTSGKPTHASDSTRRVTLGTEGLVGEKFSSTASSPAQPASIASLSDRCPRDYANMNPNLLIQRNAREIAELHSRVHETVRRREDGPEDRAIWKSACEEFRTRYESLAFPGGTLDARDRLRSGDAIAIEYALCFIEIRPYFFRSGYMYKDFLRVLKHCKLTEQQRFRYDRVRDGYLAYRRNRHGIPNGG